MSECIIDTSKSVCLDLRKGEPVNKPVGVNGTPKCLCVVVPAGEIVRCRDCRWGQAVEQVGCVRLVDRANPNGLTDPDGYCAWGERVESPSARMVELGRDVSDAYVRECERMGIAGGAPGMGYRYVSDSEDVKEG